MKKKYDISVVMSVYNTDGNYLKQSIDSIINQSFENFEFIIINDNSDKKTVEILESYNDSRIKIIHNTKNLGLTKSLNIGFSKSTGHYIARMDSDDISLPNRFLEQLRFMEKKGNEDLIVIGTYTRDVDSKKVNYSHWTNDQELLRSRLLFYNAGIDHPTAFFRRELLEKNNLKYDETILKTQDYAMWVNIIGKGRIGIVPKVLLEYRVHDKQISNVNNEEQLEYEKIIMKRQLDNFEHIFSEKERQVFYGFSRGNLKFNAKEGKDFINKLITLNHTKKVYNSKLFNKEMKRLWVISSIKRIKSVHKFDMLLNLYTITLFLPSSFFHFLKYMLLEDGRFILAKQSLYEKNTK